jgi:hypothetical protein
MGRLWRRPTLHFLAIGGLWFLGDALLAGSTGPAAGASDSVVIDAAEVAALRRDWLARTGRLPDGAELEALVADAIDREVLVREARARGLHRSDPLVRRRLVRNLRFVSDDPERGEDELFAEALALGLDRTDLVVRRRLVQIMELGARAAVPEPTPAQLEAHLARHAERFAQPPRLSLAHVFVSRDRHGEGAAAEARRLLARLRADGIGPAAAGGWGDPFLHPTELVGRSPRELAGMFGEAFAREVERIAPGRWAGPVASSYGQHLVWVRERSPARVPELASVRARVRDDWIAERAAAELAGRLRRWRDRYRIAVEAGAS